jgi:hypothetical protein
MYLMTATIQVFFHRKIQCKIAQVLEIVEIVRRFRLRPDFSYIFMFDRCPHRGATKIGSDLDGGIKSSLEEVPVRTGERLHLAMSDVDAVAVESCKELPDGQVCSVRLVNSSRIVFRKTSLVERKSPNT